MMIYVDILVEILSRIYRLCRHSGRDLVGEFGDIIKHQGSSAKGRHALNRVANAYHSAHRGFLFATLNGGLCPVCTHKMIEHHCAMLGSIRSIAFTSHRYYMDTLQHRKTFFFVLRRPRPNILKKNGKC